MPRIGFELSIDYAENLLLNIDKRLSSEAVNKKWLKKYVHAREHLVEFLEKAKTSESPHCIEEGIFDTLQSVSWNISVTETIGRDISDRVPGSYALSDAEY